MIEKSTAQAGLARRKEAIRDKATMYRLLSAGELGNTIPQYYSVQQWKESADYDRLEFWGIRSSTISAHPHTRLFVHRCEVEAWANQYFPDGVNISCMVDQVCNVTAWLEVYESNTGLVVQGVEYPPRGLSWREGMRKPSLLETWEGLEGRLKLRKHLNANSLEDLNCLLDRFPGHVVELSALEQVYGTVTHRNAITWEVRAY